MTDEIPLICDDPPEQPAAVLFAGTLTADQLARLRAAWAAGNRMQVLREARAVVLPPIRQWPDAEFCAA